MYGYFSYYPTFPSLSAFADAQSLPRFTYPTIDTKIFSHSVKSFHPLMEQGKILLEKLSDPAFARKIMEAAQQGKKSQVEHLVKLIGLKIPITTHYTPSDVIFTLHMQPDPHTSCCALSIALKWGY